MWVGISLSRNKKIENIAAAAYDTEKSVEKMVNIFTTLY